MDLDHRIKDRSYIFDCFSSKLASKYVGQVCYLSNNIEQFSDLDMANIDTLQYIGNSNFYGSDKQVFTFCLPFEFVKEKEYKPFDPETFKNHYNIGLSVIKYRRKAAKHLVYKAIVEATTFNEKTKEFFVNIRGLSYTLDELFKEYELFEDGEWKPFGIKE